ncbi:inhibitor of growth protein 4 isoform X3 [Phlebotomus argentipes]|uniref:inhibitor of growth protein 4 isoform X3 n=1 Tax=Phlebotomus argentipes TaxID=94469 RepID=UPI0028930094|nr:inhibitor of growth protein 4 isoform X3 [Phlebotomus argentipes]
MSSALYLEHYLDGLEHLPNELQRNFNLMRDLDYRAQNIMQTIDEKSQEVLQSISTDTSKESTRRETVKQIQELFNKAKEFGDDKVQLAIQTYELVDKHIRRLDSDLARFEGEIQDKNSINRGKYEDVSKKKRKGNDTKALGKKKRPQSSEDEAKWNNTNASPHVGKHKKQKKNADIEERIADLDGHATPHPSDVLDMPVDPNEPTYCLCHQVSYGEMIGCDNPDCPIEWFHFACVGLTIKPKGKWFCPKCFQDRKKK